MLIDPNELTELMVYGITGYFITLAIGAVYAFLIMRFLRGRLITFVGLVFGMFSVFVVVFFGINFVMREIWELEGVGMWTDDTINGVLLSVALGLILVIWLVLHWYMSEEVSPYIAEVEALDEEDMTQFDRNRREYMERRQKITGRGKGV